MNRRTIVIALLLLFVILFSLLLLTNIVKLSINTNVNGCYCRGIAINNQCFGFCLFGSKPTQPVSDENVEYCKEGVRGNTCVECQCDSAKDCKLVANPYVISECAEKEAVSKKTSDNCLSEVRKKAINATCVVPENYKSPDYEVVCVNNACGRILK